MSKTVLITGGARGIGKAIALEFAKLNYNVIVNYNKSEMAAKELPDNILKFRADVSNPCEVEAMFEKAGGIDILVNNAGIALYKIFQDVTENEWNDLFNINVGGVFNCCKVACTHMINQKNGCIINISSIWGVHGAAMETHYSASKGAIIAFTKAFAKELAPSGVRVNCIAPGAVNTDMLSKFTEKELEQIASEMPMGKLATPQNVAKTAVFLAESEFITGQIIQI